MTFRADIPWSDIRPSFHHAETFWKLTCAPDLMALGIFPSLKEVTESMSCVEAAFGHLPRGREEISKGLGLVVVGDGYTPRTATLAAFRSRWVCHSIDPGLHRFMEKPSRMAQMRGVERLHLYAAKAEEMQGQIEGDILLLPHSHATVGAAMGVFVRPPRLIVALPCCVQQRCPEGYREVAAYFDKGVWSPQNKVMVWKREEKGRSDGAI